MNMDNLVKVGYFRKVAKVGEDYKTSYISYKEFYSLFGEEAKEDLRRSVEMQQCKLFCACCRENNLELSITSNYVVRVKENKQQDEHLDSCPKSKLYEHWNDLAQNGVKVTEDERLVFNISLPNVVKSASSSSSSSSSSSVSDGANKRTNIFECVSALNKLAWERQTYSVKKKIHLANVDGEPQTWEYKNIDDFNKLIFGVSNDVFVRVRGEVLPFINLCYRKDLYYASDDWRRQWFFYAVVEKITPVKQERKYQYVTVRMSSDKGPKSVIRIETDIFNKIFADYMEDRDGTHRILTGYICRKSFRNDDGTCSEWMHFLKGCVVLVSRNGLICESELEATIANYMCENHIVFKKPQFPIENYGGDIPTFMIDRYNRKTLILDIPMTDKILAKRQLYKTDNEEFDIEFLDEGNYKNILEPYIKSR